VSAGLAATFLAKAMRDGRSRIEAFAGSQARLADKLTQASRIKDDFLATVSHELRTPLNAILGWSELLTKGMVSDAEVPRAIAAIHRNARIQIQLIDDLLDLSRITAGKLNLMPRAIDPEEPVAAAVETVRPASQAKDVTVQLDSRATSLIWADAEKMHQVLVNVFTNALAATPPHGTVSVSAGTHTASSEELDRGRRAADSMSPLVVTVAVRDTGCGMPEADVQKAFEPFFTTKAVGKGTGLGLFLSRETVLAHGGSLMLESKTGQGTTVIVTLPGLKSEPTHVTG